MKYVVLIYSNPTTWEALPKEEVDRVLNDFAVVVDELTASGELLNQYGLADPSNTKTIRHHAGAPVVTDGPFGEAKEFLAGVVIVDCEGIDRVTALSIPLAQYSTVEVRPLMDQGAGELV